MPRLNKNPPTLVPVHLIDGNVAKVPLSSLDQLNKQQFHAKQFLIECPDLVRIREQEKVNRERTLRELLEKRDREETERQRRKRLLKEKRREKEQADLAKMVDQSNNNNNNNQKQSVSKPSTSQNQLQKRRSSSASATGAVVSFSSEKQNHHPLSSLSEQIDEVEFGDDIVISLPKFSTTCNNSNCPYVHFQNASTREKYRRDAKAEARSGGGGGGSSSSSSSSGGGGLLLSKFGGPSSFSMKKEEFNGISAIAVSPDLQYIAATTFGPTPSLSDFVPADSNNNNNDNKNSSNQKRGKSPENNNNNNNFETESISTSVSAATTTTTTTISNAIMSSNNFESDRCRIIIWKIKQPTNSLFSSPFADQQQQQQQCQNPQQRNSNSNQQQKFSFQLLCKFPGQKSCWGNVPICWLSNVQGKNLLACGCELDGVIILRDPDNKFQQSGRLLEESAQSESQCALTSFAFSSGSGFSSAFSNKDPNNGNGAQLFASAACGSNLSSSSNSNNSNQQNSSSSSSSFSSILQKQKLKQKQNTVCVWDLELRRTKFTFSSSNNSNSSYSLNSSVVVALQFSHTRGETLMGLNTKGEILVWSTETGTLQHSLDISDMNKSINSNNNNSFSSSSYQPGWCLKCSSSMDFFMTCGNIPFLFSKKGYDIKAKFSSRETVLACAINENCDFIVTVDVKGYMRIFECKEWFRQKSFSGNNSNNTNNNNNNFISENCDMFTSPLNTRNHNKNLSTTTNNTNTSSSNVVKTIRSLKNLQQSTDENSSSSNIEKQNHGHHILTVSELAAPPIQVSNDALYCVEFFDASRKIVVAGEDGFIRIYENPFYKQRWLKRRFVFHVLYFSKHAILLESKKNKSSQQKILKSSNKNNNRRVSSVFGGGGLNSSGIFGSSSRNNISSNTFEKKSSSSTYDGNASFLKGTASSTSLKVLAASAAAADTDQKQRKQNSSSSNNNAAADDSSNNNSSTKNKKKKVVSQYAYLNQKDEPEYQDSILCEALRFRRILMKVALYL